MPAHEPERLTEAEYEDYYSEALRILTTRCDSGARTGDVRAHRTSGGAAFGKALFAIAEEQITTHGHAASS
jgi:hypothetical protein